MNIGNFALRDTIIDYKVLAILIILTAAFTLIWTLFFSCQIFTIKKEKNPGVLQSNWNFACLIYFQTENVSKKYKANISLRTTSSSSGSKRAVSTGYFRLGHPTLSAFIFANSSR